LQAVTHTFRPAAFGFLQSSLRLRYAVTSGNARAKGTRQEPSARWGLDVGRRCIADVSMLEDGFERLLAGKDDVKVLVKVRR
jgi:hypothetical protein